MRQRCIPVRDDIIRRFLSPDCSRSTPAARVHWAGEPAAAERACVRLHHLCTREESQPEAAARFRDLRPIDMLPRPRSRLNNAASGSTFGANCSSCAPRFGKLQTPSLQIDKRLHARQPDAGDYRRSPSSIQSASELQDRPGRRSEPAGQRRPPHPPGSCRRVSILRNLANPTFSSGVKYVATVFPISLSATRMPSRAVLIRFSWVRSRHSLSVIAAMPCLASCSLSTGIADDADNSALCSVA